jgi:hypothetical protein
VGELPGHFSQILGDSAEDDFYALARAIGYGIIRRRNPTPGIDFVAEFSGTPAEIENSILLRPPYSPDGLTAFSVKSGDSESSDVTQLTDYVDQCRRSGDGVLQQIRGGVLVVGTTKTQHQLRDMLSQNVFCWDVRRLIFYSMKAKTVAQLSETGNVTEHPLGAGLSGGFVLAPLRGSSRSLIDAEVHVFVDDHELVVQGDHMRTILEQVYTTGLEPIVRAMRYDIRVRMSLHALGPIQRSVVADAYRRYYTAGNHPGLMTPVIQGLEMQSYATAPWTAMFRA